MDAGAAHSAALVSCGLHRAARTLRTRSPAPGLKKSAAARKKSRFLDGEAAPRCAAARARALLTRGTRAGAVDRMTRCSPSARPLSPTRSRSCPAGALTIAEAERGSCEGGIATDRLDEVGQTPDQGRRHGSADRIQPPQLLPRCRRRARGTVARGL